MTHDELEVHAYTARKLLNADLWTPTRLLWARLVGHLDSALSLEPPDHRKAGHDPMRPHVSAHKAEQLAVQEAHDTGFKYGLTAAFAFIVEHKDSALTLPELERAFAERFFADETEGERE